MSGADRHGGGQMKHTPGPWQWSVNLVCPSDLKGCFVDIYENGRLCILAGVLSKTVGHQGICEANARLMASSPELVELLQESVICIETGQQAISEARRRIGSSPISRDGPINELLARAHAIIAKAKGEAA